LWAWLDKYNDEDAQIAVELIAHWGNTALLLELEAITLRATEHHTTFKFQERCKVMQTQLHEQLSLSDAEVILLRLPERIRTALIDRAAEIDYPIEAVVEMAFT
jgi:hypothetical protein